RGDEKALISQEAAASGQASVREGGPSGRRGPLRAETPRFLDGELSALCLCGGFQLLGAATPSRPFIAGRYPRRNTIRDAASPTAPVQIAAFRVRYFVRATRARSKQCSLVICESVAADNNLSSSE